MSLTDLTFGDKVKPVAIERFKGEEGTPDVIGLMSSKIKASFTHYDPRTGYFYCFKGECCQNLGLPSVRYILPVVQYTLLGKANDLANLDYGAPITLKYLSLGKESYEKLKVKWDLNGDLTHKDLLVICDDAGYQKLSFEVLQAKESKWRSDPALLQQVKELANDYKLLIDLSVARNVTVDKMLELLAAPIEERPNTRQSKPAPARQAPRLAPSSQVSHSQPAQQALPGSPPTGPAGAAKQDDFDFDSIIDNP